MYLKSFFGVILFICTFFSAAGQDYESQGKGDWVEGESWEGGSSPGTDNIQADVEIYGHITAHSSLDYHSGVLTVNDTLVIHGDLDMGNNADLVLNSGSVVIIYGDLDIGNQVDIAADGTLIITGNMTKDGASQHGSFNSEKKPSQVYIGGDKPDIDDSDVLDCEDEGHESSGCNYGDMEDVKESDAYDFFQEGCPVEITSVWSNSPVTTGATIELEGDAQDDDGGELTYEWRGPQGFFSDEKETAREDVTKQMSGGYTFLVFSEVGCHVSEAVNVEVIDLPYAEISSLITNTPACEGEDVILEIEVTGTPPFTFSLEDDQGGEWEDIIVEKEDLEGEGPYLYEFTVPDPPQWLNNGDVFTDYLYTLKSVSTDEEGDGSVAGEGVQVKVYRVPVSGPKFHIANEE